MCSYCGNLSDTRDHVPSKVLLTKPYPENMHVVGCCFECNQSFSNDEVYFVCLMECIVNGTTEIDKLQRVNIQRILRQKPHLHKIIQQSYITEGQSSYFKPDWRAIENIVLKFARGHAAYEGSAPQLDPPTHIAYKPLYQLNDKERHHFFSEPEVTVYPEVGSRLFEEVVLDNNTPFSLWITVEDRIYSYLISSSVSGFSVRIVIYDYLVAEVSWR